MRLSPCDSRHGSDRNCDSINMQSRPRADDLYDNVVSDKRLHVPMGGMYLRNRLHLCGTLYLQYRRMHLRQRVHLPIRLQKSWSVPLLVSLLKMPLWGLSRACLNWSMSSSSDLL